MSSTVEILDKIARRIMSTDGGGISEHMYSSFFLSKEKKTFYNKNILFKTTAKLTKRKITKR